MKYRTLSRLAAAAISVAALCSNALAKDSVTMMLNYTVNGAVAPFYLGKVKGYFDAEGIDLKLMEGHGSGPTVQAVATHNVDIGYADFSTMVKVAAMGAPVKAIGVLMQENPTSVVGLAEKNIKTPQDIKGKTVAVAPGDASSQLWTMFMNKVGLKESDFKTITGNPQTTINAVITGQADLLVGFATMPLISVEQATRKPAHALLFADYNVNVATLSIIARDDMIRDNADLLKRFMRATARSVSESEKDPAVAVDALLKTLPAAGSRDTMIRTLKATIPFYRTAETRNAPIFHVSAKNITDSVSAIVQYSKLDKSANDPARYYTGVFVP
ncbi:ABC transporter substrate-binding protein [Paraburkholderia sp. GAS42]|jgi:NitT/TauT family transport system substrate-binding protein|uniref:ABC transporter substrate-binding protein n=1 Tax=Paraburkholderia sp. GAS42 TaxID=3035135 RepID=UPI003D1D8E9C